MQVEIVEGVAESEAEMVSSTLTETVMSDPSCPLPQVTENNLVQVTLLKPSRSFRSSDSSTPLLLYVPGMDCTGQGINRQLMSLNAAG